MKFIIQRSHQSVKKMDINRNQTTPIHRQLSLILEDQIVLGEWISGMLLPTENELCEEYHVSRITVRKALDNLERKGLINRIQGKGSFVSKPINNANNAHKGFSQIIRESGLEPQSRFLGEELIEKNSEIVKLLELPNDTLEQFWSFKRLRLFNNEPAAITQTIVRRNLGDQMRSFDLNQEISFYDLYKRILKRNVVRNEGLIKAISVNAEEADLLKVKIGSAHLWYRGVAYIEGNIPIEVNFTIYHGEKFSFHRPDTYILDGKENM